jgi:hypothetical protein
MVALYRSGEYGILLFENLMDTTGHRSVLFFSQVVTDGHNLAQKIAIMNGGRGPGLAWRADHPLFRSHPLAKIINVYAGASGRAL